MEAVVADRRERRKRLRALRVAEREVVLLHRHDVREVGAELEAELERDGFQRLVLERDVVLHPVAYEAQARDRDLVLVEPAGQRVAHVEGGRVVLDLRRGEQERPRFVDPQLQLGEEARVLGEEPGRPAVEVADVVADAERRAFEDRQRHWSSRTMRTAEDCASAFTTSSSMFTCGGRVTANTTQSATSSAVSAATPS